MFATANTRIINKNEESEDLKININSDECIYTDKIIDPINKYNISGYIIKDNTSISINLSNRNILPTPFILNNYYCRNLNGKSIIIKNMDQRYTPGTEVSVIPEHTYKMLKSTNRLKDRLFLIKFTYELIDNDLSDKYKNIATLSENNFKNSKKDIYVDRDGNYIIKKEKTFCFQLVSPDEFEAYKSLNKKNDKNNLSDIKSPK